MYHVQCFRHACQRWDAGMSECLLVQGHLKHCTWYMVYNSQYPLHDFYCNHTMAANTFRKYPLISTVARSPAHFHSPCQSRAYTITYQCIGMRNLLALQLCGSKLNTRPNRQVQLVGAQWLRRLLNYFRTPPSVLVLVCSSHTLQTERKVSARRSVIAGLQGSPMRDQPYEAAGSGEMTGLIPPVLCTACPNLPCPPTFTLLPLPPSPSDLFAVVWSLLQ